MTCCGVPTVTTTFKAPRVEVLYRWCARCGVRSWWVGDQQVDADRALSALGEVGRTAPRPKRRRRQLTAA